jgi:hypothetical protein
MLSSSLATGKSRAAEGGVRLNFSQETKAVEEGSAPELDRSNVSVSGWNF